MPITDPGRKTVQSMIDKASGGEEFNVTAVEGQAVELPATSKNLTVRVQGAADLTSFSLKVPPDAASMTGQRLFFRFEIGIADFRLIGEPGDTIDGADMNMQPNDNAVFYKYQAKTWSRID